MPRKRPADRKTAAASNAWGFSLGLYVEMELQGEEVQVSRRAPPAARTPSLRTGRPSSPAEGLAAGGPGRRSPSPPPPTGPTRVCTARA